VDWISKIRSGWRVSFLVLAVIAILMGPWFLMDTISVPEPHECSYPWVRIDENLCRYADSYRFTLFSIPGVSLLPVLSSSMVLMDGNRKWLQILNSIAWAVAGGYSLVIRLTNPEIFSTYLGVRLYLIIALLALLFELIIFIIEHSKMRWVADT
jgi:hypothetical protein